jgi:hypothetical protein
VTTALRRPFTKVRDAMLAVAPGRYWLMVVLVTLLAYAAAYVTYTYENGPNGLFRGDARWYMLMTYQLLGNAKPDAIEHVAVFLEPRGLHIREYNFGGLAQQVVQLRWIYPVLSVPFVAVLGGYGMLVVPFLCTVFNSLALMYLVSRLVGPKWGLVAVGAWVGSHTVMLWQLPALTEPLVTAMIFGILLVLPLGRRATRRDLVVFTVLLLALTFTRQATAYPVGAVGLTWLVQWAVQRRFRNEWFPFAALGAAVFVLTSALSSLIAPIDVKGQMVAAARFVNPPDQVQNFDDALRLLPHTIKAIVMHDLHNIRYDGLMVLMLALGVIAVLARPRHRATTLLIGAFIPYAVLNILQSTYSGFRYQSSLFPMLYLAVVVFIAHLTGVRSRMDGPPEISADPAPAPEGPAPAEERREDAPVPTAR